MTSRPALNRGKRLLVEESELSKIVRMRFQMLAGRKGTARTHRAKNRGSSLGFHKKIITTMAQAMPIQAARQ